MFEDPKEPKNKIPLIDISLDILNFRLSTIDPEDKTQEVIYYQKGIRKNVEILETETPEEIFHKSLGILNEALFYIACKENLPIDIRISTAREDIAGIDFILESEGGRMIDVTANAIAYPQKMTAKTTIILSERSYIDNILIFNKDINTREYLVDVFNTNMEILNNRYPEFIVKTEVRKRGRKYFVKPVFSKYKNIQIHTKEGSRKKSRILLTENQYKETIEVLSMLKNFSLEHD